MTKRRAFVITRTPGFGEQVVQALEVEGRFTAQIFSEFDAALKEGQREPFDMVVLDADAADQPLEQAARALRRVCPATALILIPPGNWVSSALVNRIAPDGMLTKPLSLADLTQLLEEIHHRFFAEFDHLEREDNLEQKSTAPLLGFDFVPPPQVKTPPQVGGEDREPGLARRGLVVIREGANRGAARSSHSWLYDVSKAAQYLAMLSLETSAQAALLVRDGALWAYAGQVSQPEAQELTQVIAAQWKRQMHTPGKSHDPQHSDRSDLIRFIRLASNQEYLLYVTSLIDDLTLALAFDAGIPFRMIRAQALHLAQALSQPPDSQRSIVETQSLVSARSLEGSTVPDAHSGDPRAASSSEQDSAGTPGKVSLPSAFPDNPPSSPVRIPQKPRPAITQIRGQEQKERPAGVPLEGPPPRGFTMPSGLPISPAILHTGKPDLDDREDIAAAPPSIQFPVSAQPEQAPLALEPVTPALSGLLYTCVIVPRLPSHSLSGDLAARLAEWMPMLCLAYGWRLEKLEQRKDFLAWVVRVQLDTSPSSLMRILRQQTSQRIFADFPALTRENPSGDFWAPGYLILSSGALPSPDTIRSFIQQTRLHQGGTGPMILSNSR